MRKVLFVINPRAGNREGGRLELAISEESRNQSFEYTIYRLQSSEEESNVRAEIERYQPDIVAVGGGDGTVNLLAKVLNGKDLPLLIIPLGSANGMAKELGIGGKTESSLALISAGMVRNIDLLDINGHLCIHLGDVGVNASIVQRFEQDPQRGLWIYAKHLFKELFLIRDHRYQLMLDDKPLKRRAISLTIANASKYGTGAVINPLGKLDDGKFEIVIIKPFPRIHLLSISWKMFTGKLQTSEFVEVFSCERAVIQTAKRTTLQVDGEIIGKTREITVKILPKALSILVPSEN